MQLGELNNLSGLDLTSVDTDFPNIRAGLYPWKINSSKLVPTKKDATKLMWELELELAGPAKDTKDRDVNPGYKLPYRFMVSPTEKLTNEMIFRSIAQLLDAVYGEEVRRQIKIETLQIEALIGMELNARTKITPATDEYPEKAEISSLVRKTA